MLVSQIGNVNPNLNQKNNLSLDENGQESDFSFTWLAEGKEEECSLGVHGFSFQPLSSAVMKPNT